MGERSPGPVTWDVWYPEAGSTGLPFARGRLDPAAALWVHAAPPTLSVVVRDAEGRVLAQAEGLKREGPRFPMTRLALNGKHVSREDRWPRADDLGARVLLPGGEVGTLTSWWNAEDGSEWRWDIQFYNSR